MNNYVAFLVVEMGNKNIFKLTFCQVIQWGKIISCCCSIIMHGIQIEVPFAHFTEKMGLIWLNQHLLCPHYNNNFLQNTCKYPYI